MDPVTMQFAIKALDVLFLTGMYLMERAASKQEYAQGQALVAEAAALRAKAEEGTITPEQLDAGLDRIQAEVVAPMRAAVNRL